DTSIINAALLNTSYAVAKPDGSGFERSRIGGDQLGFGPFHRIYETADGWICVAARSKTEQDKLLSALGVTGAAAIGAKLKSFGAGEAFKTLDAAGVPAEIVDPEFSRRLHDDPVAQKHKWVVSYPHPVVGKLDQIGLLFSLSDTPGVIQGRPLL